MGNRACRRPWSIIMAGQGPENRDLAQVHEDPSIPEPRQLNPPSRDPLPDVEEAEGEPLPSKKARVEEQPQVLQGLEEGDDLNQVVASIKAIPRRQYAKLPPDVRVDYDAVKKYAKNLEKMAEAEEAKVERITKKHKDMYIPMHVEARGIDEVVPFVQMAHSFPLYEPTQFAPGQVKSPVNIDDGYELSDVVYPKITSNMLNLENLDRIDPANAEFMKSTDVMLSLYRDRIRKLAGKLSFGQIYSPWIYEFIFEQGMTTHNHHLRVQYVMALEYELCGAIPYLPLPVEFEMTYLELFRDVDEAYKEDIEIIQFARHPRTAVIPPRVLQALPALGTLTGMQLFLNYITGRQMITPESDRIIQVCRQRDGAGILVTNRFGNVLYASRGFRFIDTCFLTPAIFFHNTHVMVKRCDIEDRDQLYSMIATAIQFDINGQVPSSRMIDTGAMAIPGYESNLYSNAGRIAQRLEAFKTPVVKASHVPLPGVSFIGKHIWVTHTDCNGHLMNLYDSILTSLNSESVCPLSMNMFRFCPRGQGNIATVVIPNSQLHDSQKEVTEQLHAKEFLRHFGLMGTFVFRWEAKGIPRSSLSKEMIKEALGTGNSKSSETIFLDMYAPLDMTIVIWVTNKAINDTLNYELCKLIKCTFKQRYDIFDLIDIDHGGSVMNLFTRSNGQQIAKMYQCTSVIEHDYMDKFSDYLDAFNQGSTDTSILNKINIKVKEGLDSGYTANTLLSFVERVYGTGNRTLIINSITTQSAFQPNVAKAKPRFPMSIVSPDVRQLAGYTDNQLWIINFVSKILEPRGHDKGADYRNLLICGPPRAFKTSFAYFLDKFFHVYWKGVGMKGTHEFWRSIPKETQVIIMDEWTPQESDWLWLNKVGEGSEHSVDQKYKEDNVIPAGTRILLLTNRHAGEIRNACVSSTKGKDNAAEELWTAFTRRFAIANLTGNEIPCPGGGSRKDVVQPNMSSDHFERQLIKRGDGDIRIAEGEVDNEKTRRLLAISLIVDLTRKVDELIQFVEALATENDGLAVIVKHHTISSILRRNPTEDMVLSIIAELSDLINAGLS